jgi:hypothetical protein
MDAIEFCKPLSKLPRMIQLRYVMRTRRTSSTRSALNSFLVPSLLLNLNPTRLRGPQALPRAITPVYFLTISQ